MRRAPDPSGPPGPAAPAPVPGATWRHPRRLATVAGPVAFALAAVAAGLVVDGSDGGAGSYSHVHQFVSELAATGSPGRWIMTAGFLAYGAAQVLLGRSLATTRVLGATVAVLVTASGLATLGAGTFPCEPGCPTTGDRSLGQLLHDGTSVVAFLAWIAAATVAGWRARTTGYGRLSLALGAVQLVGALTLAGLDAAGGDGPVGLVQRTSLAAAATWIVATAHHHPPR